MIATRALLASIPLGAICLIGSLTAPYHALMLITDSETLASNPSTHTMRLVLAGRIGVLGAVLLSVGMIHASRRSWPSASRMLLLLGAAGFLMTIPFAGYATMRLMREFSSLAVSESFNMDDFIASIRPALGPTLVGAAGMVLGGLAVLTAGWQLPKVEPARSPVRRVAFIVACGSSLLLVLAALGLTAATLRLHEQLNPQTAVKAHEIARNVIAILYAAFLMLFSIAGFGGGLVVQGFAARETADSISADSDN